MDLLLKWVMFWMEFQEHDIDCSFQKSSENLTDIVKLLKDTKTDILINYLPVGSQQATEYYANICLEADVAFLNCIPVFIAMGKEIY